MTDEEMTKAVRMMLELLRPRFRWLRDMTNQSTVPLIYTNVGVLTYYGVVSGEHRTHHLQAASQVPTSQQKVLMLEVLIQRVATELGAPMGPERQTSRNDPTDALIGVLAGEDAQGLLDRAAQYRNIEEPVTINIMWPGGGLTA